MPLTVEEVSVWNVALLKQTLVYYKKHNLEEKQIIGFLHRHFVTRVKHDKLVASKKTACLKNSLPPLSHDITLHKEGRINECHEIVLRLVSIDIRDSVFFYELQ